MSTPRTLLVAAVCSMLISLAHADQISFANSGGSTAVSAGVSITSNVATPAGSLTLSCPQTSPTICSGGSFSFASSDGTNIISGAFTSGKFTETCAGGGKGGHITCAYGFSGSFSGTWTANGVSQGIIGETSQGFGVNGAAAAGSTAVVSAYTPFYYSDSEQIHRSDDLQGTNQISYGGQGIGFYGAYGLALDSAGRIYVSDTYNCRVTRMDDMIGTNWTTYGGTCGSGQGQFYDPSGIAVDFMGRIYVMDTGNSRLVRIDDMSGTNWVAFSSVGSGTGQLSQFLSVAVDSIGRIYVPDTGRLVRMDDMTGTNFTVLTQSPPINGFSHIFEQPIAVALDAAGSIYVADNVASGAVVVRVDDMTGTNWAQIVTSPTGSTGLNSISVDGSGTAFTGGGGARAIVNMAAVFNSSGSVGPIGSYYVFGVTALPLPGQQRPSAVSLNPATLNFSQNVGTTGSLPVTISNFGGSPLNIGNIAASIGFSANSNCPSQLPGGSTCTVTVSFTPSATGSANGSLTITDDSFNLGTTQILTLTGTGTAPAASVTPASLTFSSQVLNTSSTARTVTLQDTGTGPMQVSNVAVSGPFTQINNCGSLAAGASCTIQVVFTPVALGAASGTLTITDDSGTQTVTVSGNGSAPVTFSPSSLNFGQVAVGNTSAAMTVTVNNRSTAALSFTSIVASAGFTIASNTCGTGIAAGANCAVGVTFTPAATGSVTGTLTFTDSAATSPQAVNLSGSGSTAVTFSSNTLNFGSVAVGATSSVKSVTLTNRQSVVLNISSMSASTGFAVANTTCGASLAAGAGCTIGMTFTPAALGTATGTLTVTDDAANSPQVLNLAGTGVAPVSASPTSLSFNTAVGSTSSARTVTLSNRQSGALNISGIAISASFNITSTTCGASLAAGANCTVSVTFSPTASGPVTGSLIFTDDAPNNPQTVNLTGNSGNNNN